LNPQQHIKVIALQEQNDMNNLKLKNDLFVLLSNPSAMIEKPETEALPI